MSRFSYTNFSNDEIVRACVATVSLAIFILVSTFVSPYVLVAGSLKSLPRIHSQYGSYRKRVTAFLHQAESLYREGYSHFKEGIWRITTTDGDRVMVPNIYLDELKAQPEEKISNRKALLLAAECKYTGIAMDTTFLTHLVRNDLTKNLAMINARLCEEVQRSVQAELPQSRDWNAVVINEKLLRIVAMVSGNAFLGPDLCRRDEYLHASIRYAVDVNMAVRGLKRWPRLLRPLGQYFVPQLSRIAEHKRRAKAFFEPVIRERRAMMERGDPVPEDMLQWMLLKSDDFHIHDDAELAFQQLSLTLASIHSTTMTLTQMIFDLVSQPEVVPVLREEIGSVLKENGGVLTTQALFSMKILDSFMRESQRMNPLSMTRFTRYVEKPVTLRDGTRIPASVIIEAPFIAITRDPELYPNPEVLSSLFTFLALLLHRPSVYPLLILEEQTFDPYRFSRLRSGQDKDSIGYKSPEQYQFVSVSKENLNFGFGRNACPGRFFAANEIKLILARILLDFDLKMPEGRTKRYENLVIAGGIIPDTKNKILLRKISRSEKNIHHR